MRAAKPRLALAAAAAAALWLAGSAAAIAADEPWPARPVRVIVAQAPGGPPDLIARFIAEPLGRALGVPIVVENRPGASGIIGVNAAAGAPPDGYTLLIGTLSTHALVPHANANVPYDPVRDFTPIVNLFRSIKVLWINPALPAQNLAEWIAYANARPGQLNFASGGVGSSNHIDMELLKTLTGLDLVHVPYNGPSAAIAAVAKGDAQAMIVSIGTGLPLAQGGKIRPLVIFGDRRSPLLRDVPIAAEQGLARLDLSAWIGLLGPASMPGAFVGRISAEVAKILRSPEAIAFADRHGLEILGGSSAAFGATIAADYGRWGEPIRRLNLRAE